MATTVTRLISATVPVVATAVETAAPSMALSSPMTARTPSTASTSCPSATVTEKSAAESL